MEKQSPMFCTLKATAFFLMLVIAITCATAVRILDEAPEASPVEDPPIEAPEASPVEDPPIGAPEATPAAPVAPPVAIAAAPAATVGPKQTGAPAATVEGPVEAPEATTPGAPVAPPVANVAAPTQAAAAGAAVAAGEAHHPLTFFMHDVLGGSHPTARVVTGIGATSDINNQLPFAKNNPNVLPINGAVPLPSGKNGLINTNNAPFLTGLGGQTTTSINGNTLPFVSAGQLPAGSTLQKLMFGTTTVFDDELTEGHELGSAVIGKAQGFYVASSQDGTSQTLAFTAIFEGDGHYEDSLSFFGVHRTASPESQVAVVGGTGKYANAKGYAAIQTLHPQDQHTTDGVETSLQFSVYLS